MIEESTRLQEIRLERLQDLQNRHHKELKEFDAVSRRHVEGSPRASSRHSYTSGIADNERGGSGRFNKGSPRHSNRSLGTPSGQYPLAQQQQQHQQQQQYQHQYPQQQYHQRQPSRESSISMTSLQYTEPPAYDAHANNMLGGHSNSVSAGSNNSGGVQNRSRQSSVDSRNGKAGDRRSYHGPPSSTPRR